MMALKRRKLFTSIVKKEIGKQHRSKINKHKEMLLQCKRVASHCVKYARQKALQSARTVKEQQWRMKRLARENIAYWKRSRRFDREIKKRLEKEAEEQRKIDHELVEAKRQQRKLNFLITQTELYAHFMSKKLGTVSTEEQLRILSQLDEDSSNKPLCDTYDSDAMKELAKKNALDAFQSEKSRTKHFDQHANSCLGDFDSIDGEQPQPELFMGKLKGYQLRGMNWLANLYSQGISGILADEMGLGKTVQSIAFLCHIAEKYSVWGPFLIISPASTLHNWQQEIAKFVPDFKVVPYWGNPNERKILRQFWDQKDIYTKDASFHIVVTSYQIVITDIKYFNRIKWQYMILDEAQAIKSTSSMRWKTLLGFSCRNRLLLSGTPIQNSMAELWALLHFIMPTLFDSHEEFNEWFSKDIENHAENKTGIDEKHLSRLHMILKPFMLRRIKKDVENELSDKIEVMVYCPLTTRQNLLYLALKQKIKIEDLLHYTVGGGDSHTVDKNFTSNLMNLVMQFRKVCNHPELFERRDAKSPIRILPLQYRIPYIIYDANIRQIMALKFRKHFIFQPNHIADSVNNNSSDTIFNFCLSLNLSVNDIYRILQGDILHRWRHYYDTIESEYKHYHEHLWNPRLCRSSIRMNHTFKLCPAQIESSSLLSDLIFTRQSKGNRVFYTFTDHKYHSMPETIEHKNIRLKNRDFFCDDSVIDTVSEKIESSIYSRKAAWDLQRHIDDYSFNSMNYYWSQATTQKFKYKSAESLYPQPHSCDDDIRPINGWSNIVIPDKECLVSDSGKLSVLDGLLKRLKEEGHRVLIYSQMTKMIDLLEEYMWHRHHKYMRLDGSSKISERRDMVADFQARTDIFVFLLSTRAGGLGINLTAADTVIFYDSDWNPTVDQQAMDRAHRLGQTKQVTVYRLICKGSIEERILQRAREKSEIQKLVISGGNFKPDTLKPKEVVSLLLDDDELVQKYHLKIENPSEEQKELEKKQKILYKTVPGAVKTKKLKQEIPATITGPEDRPNSANGHVDSAPNSPYSTHSDILADDIVDGGYNDDVDSPITHKYTVYNVYGSAVKPRFSGRGTSKRGRPRGSRSRTLGMTRNNSTSHTSSSSGVYSSEVNPVDSASSISSAQSSPSGSFMDIPITVSGSGSKGQTPAVRRGPGRPRLKPGGPCNAGSRGTYRPRKPARPLPVPLPSDGTNSTISNVANNAQYSSYSFYDFPDD
nr:putative DNA helicase Ino80 [Leptinotarsa decemlineata]